ncbi:MAG: HAMP domain-containing histidine kinase [Lachnospiraceae bacterium]|nr:HAMP domain-containing histidine kinase [Lachnospiraceae bacterium]
MATKLRRLKNKLAILLTVLGVICVGVGIGLSVHMQLYMSDKYGFDVLDFDYNYQDTIEFKTFMEKRLATLLSMGVNGRCFSIYSFSEGNTGDVSSYYFNSMPYEENYQNTNHMVGKIYNKAIKYDKNIAYAVISKGSIIYSNYDWPRPSAIRCPSGYNYELRYKNGRVSIFKGGVETDVYGDGYYSEDDWYVPGYENFQVTEKLDTVEVVIYAIKKPQYYESILSRYNANTIAHFYNKNVSDASVLSDSDGWFDMNASYFIAQGVEEVTDANVSRRMFLVAGIIFCAAAFFVSGIYIRMARLIGGIFYRIFQKDFGSGYTAKNKKNFFLFMFVDIMALLACMAISVMVATGQWKIYSGILVCAVVFLILGLFAYMYIKVMAKDMSAAVEDSLKNERMKVELVTNVSHDIKTPLTSIISYIKLLKEEELPDYAVDYVNIIDNKSERLKCIVADVFDISKASSGQLPIDMKVIDFGRLISQTVADMQEAINKSEITIILDIPEKKSYIEADGNRMYRVIQNLIQNTLLYSLPGSRVHITLSEQNNVVMACIANTSKNSISNSIDFTERFVRGDASRSDGGSGLGLSIAKSFTEACKGTFKIETCMDMFMVKVSFEVVREQDSDC